MKTKRIAKFLGLGLAISLAFSLGSALLPVGVRLLSRLAELGLATPPAPRREATETP